MKRLLCVFLMLLLLCGCAAESSPAPTEAPALHPQRIKRDPAVPAGLLLPGGPPRHPRTEEQSRLGPPHPPTDMNVRGPVASSW